MRLLLILALPLVIIAPQAIHLTAGQPAAFVLTATGGTPPYKWSIGSGALPPGLTLQQYGNQGLVSGVPISAGQFGGTFKVTDSSGKIATYKIDVKK